MKLMKIGKWTKRTKTKRLDSKLKIKGTCAANNKSNRNSIKRIKNARERNKEADYNQK